MRRSKRAKEGTRIGLDMRIAIIKKRINELHGEVTTYNSYLGRGLNDKWIRHVITTIKNKIKIREAQLKRYEDRKAKYKREGWL